MSHGSTMMLGEDSAPGFFWRQVGQEAKRRGVKGIVWMGAHWECTGEGFEIAANPTTPKKQPVGWVDPQKYTDLQIPVDVNLAKRVQSLLAAKGIPSKLNPDVEWVHDTFLVMRWMFGDKGPVIPCTLISTNAYYDPWKLVDIGSAIRELRYENVLIIGTGGTVHNLYRNKWSNIVLHRDNFAQDTPPAEFALDFRTIAEDALTKNTGPALRSAVMRLMRHPLYRDAHGTDDHWAPVLFVAGACGAEEDIPTRNYAPAECWELVNMANTQFQFGDWDPVD